MVVARGPPPNCLDHNTASSHALYTYLAVSVSKASLKTTGLVYLSWIVKLLAQLLPHIEVGGTTLQLGEKTIEVGRDGQVKYLEACFDSLPDQMQQAPRPPFITCITISVCDCYGNSIHIVSFFFLGVLSSFMSSDVVFLLLGICFWQCHIEMGVTRITCSIVANLFSYCEDIALLANGPDHIFEWGFMDDKACLVNISRLLSLTLSLFIYVFFLFSLWGAWCIQNIEKNWTSGKSLIYNSR